MNKMKILFVCKHNRFRSKVAETIFKKLGKGEARSAGVALDLLHPYIEPVVIKIMKEKGYKIKGKPRKLTKEDLNWADKIVIAADDVDEKLFSGFKGKIIRWKIQDVDALDVKKIKKIIDEIERKVKNLISSLK